MVYGRTVGEHELTFEPSGALEGASLVMRDRETDSWWSLMRSRAIAGTLQGSQLEEISSVEKTTWSKWRAQHPQTHVLSVDGVEHVSSNPYENYFVNERTFRGLKVDDDRLAPKEPIYAFERDGSAYAVSHEDAAGGALMALGDPEGLWLLVYRPGGASILASTRGRRLR